MCIKKRNKSSFINSLLRTINRPLIVLLGGFPPPFFKTLILTSDIFLTAVISKIRQLLLAVFFMSVAEVLFLPLFFKIAPDLDCWLLHSPCRLSKNKSIRPLFKHDYVLYTQGHTGP